MKSLFENWRRFVNEEGKDCALSNKGKNCPIHGLEECPVNEAKKLACPPATQDLKLNTKNRDAAVKAEHIQYGPLNVDEPGDYWKDIADSWNTSEESAKKSLCGNCVAFDVSPRMKECMPDETSDEDGELGYCWMHHFKCHSARACRTWAKGGPITDDSKSKERQSKSSFGEKESIDEQ